MVLILVESSKKGTYMYQEFSYIHIHHIINYSVLYNVSLTVGNKQNSPGIIMKAISDACITYLACRIQILWGVIKM